MDSLMDQRDDVQVLRDWIEERGCTVRWLADQIGWSRGMLSQVINGKRPLSRKLASVLREQFDIDLQGQAHRNTGTRKEQ